MKNVLYNTNYHKFTINKFTVNSWQFLFFSEERYNLFLNQKKQFPTPGRNQAEEIDIGCVERVASWSPTIHGLCHQTYPLRWLPLFHRFLENMTKIWPNLGCKRKRILHFDLFWVTCKILLYPGRDLNPHALASSRFWVYRVYHSTTRANSLSKIKDEMWWLNPEKQVVFEYATLCFTLSFHVQRYTFILIWQFFFHFSLVLGKIVVFLQSIHKTTNRHANIW